MLELILLTSSTIRLSNLRHMHGFGSHAFKWVNANGQGVWVKYHFKTEQGVKNLDVELAAKLAGENPDYHNEDLFNAIDKGDFPAWKLYVQIMPLEDAKNVPFRSLRYNQSMVAKGIPSN